MNSTFPARMAAQNETPTIDEPIVAEPIEAPPAEDAPVEETTPPGASGSGFRVILYDDDYHAQDEVAEQIHKATKYAPRKCWAIMMEAHAKGRAICFNGAREKCQKVARVLREIRLQCEVDCD